MCRLMYNTLRTTYEPALMVLSAAMADEVGRAEGYTAIVDAIEAAIRSGPARRPANCWSQPPRIARILDDFHREGTRAESKRERWY